MRLNAPLNGLAAVLLIAATRDGVAQRPTSTVRDSAGIVIVANSSPLTSPVMFRIGGPAFDLNTGTQAGMSNSNLRGIRLPDGRIVVVADALEGAPVAGLPTPTSSAGLRFLDPRGNLLTAVPIDGAGTEAGRISQICLISTDTLVVGTPREINWLSTREMIPHQVPTENGELFGCLRDGTLLTTAGPKSTGTWHIVARRTDGSTVHDFGIHLYGALILPVSSGIYDANRMTGQVGVFGDSGRTRRLIRFAEAPRKIDVDTVHVDSLLAWRNLPARFQRALADGTGRLWIQDAASPNWTAFDVTGAIIGRLSLPTPTGLGQGTVLSFEESEIVVRARIGGEVHLTFYPLVPVPRN